MHRSTGWVSFSFGPMENKFDCYLRTIIPYNCTLNFVLFLRTIFSWRIQSKLLLQWTIYWDSMDVYSVLRYFYFQKWWGAQLLGTCSTIPTFLGHLILRLLNTTPCNSVHKYLPFTDGDCRFCIFLKEEEHLHDILRSKAGNTHGKNMMAEKCWIVPQYKVHCGSIFSPSNTSSHVFPSHFTTCFEFW